MTDPTELTALLRERPPASPGQSLLVWLAAYSGVVVTIVLGIFAYFGGRSLPPAGRYGLLAGVLVFGLGLGATLSRLVEDWEAERSGLIGRWRRWWAAVQLAAARQPDQAAGVPTLDSLPRHVRRWLTRSSR